MASNRRGRDEIPKDVQISKTLAYILRHGAEKEGLTMRKGKFSNHTMIELKKNLILKIYFLKTAL
jgi:2'-phosphotransferase